MHISNRRQDMSTNKHKDKQLESDPDSNSKLTAFTEKYRFSCQSGFSWLEGSFSFLFSAEKKQSF